MAKRRTVFVLLDGGGDNLDAGIRAICGVYTTLGKAQFRAEQKLAKAWGIDDVQVLRSMLGSDKTKWVTSNIFDMDDAQPPRKVSKLRHIAGGELYVIYTVVEMVLQ